MDDFGKILDKWENTGSRRKTTPDSDRAGAPMMGDWLDRYPPDSDDLPESQDSSGEERRVRPEKLKIDDSLDLHGLTLNEALAATGDFVERSVTAGHRKILVIHGKGANGQGVLRQQVRAYLEHHPMTGAMGYGRGAEGGRGALWVVLREGRGQIRETDRQRSR